MFFGPLLLIVFVVLIVYLFAGTSDRRIGLRTSTPEQTPLDILDERLARGEIDRREYDDKRQVLDHG